MQPSKVPHPTPKSASIRVPLGRVFGGRAFYPRVVVPMESVRIPMERAFHLRVSIPIGRILGARVRIPMGKAPHPRLRVPMNRVLGGMVGGERREQGRLWSIRTCKPVLHGLSSECLVGEYSKHHGKEKKWTGEWPRSLPSKKERERCTRT